MTKNDIKFNPICQPWNSVGKRQHINMFQLLSYDNVVFICIHSNLRAEKESMVMESDEYKKEKNRHLPNY